MRVGLVATYASCEREGNHRRIKRRPSKPRAEEASLCRLRAFLTLIIRPAVVRCGQLHDAGVWLPALHSGALANGPLPPRVRQAQGPLARPTKFSR